VDEHSHLLVTRPAEPHPRSCLADAAVHLGDRNSPPRLQLDLDEQTARNPRREGEHDASIAGRARRNRTDFVPEAQQNGK
jgi:hypothetical protein